MLRFLGLIITLVLLLAGAGCSDNQSSPPVQELTKQSSENGDDSYQSDQFAQQSNSPAIRQAVIDYYKVSNPAAKVVGVAIVSAPINCNIALVKADLDGVAPNSVVADVLGVSCFHDLSGKRYWKADPNPILAERLAIADAGSHYIDLTRN